jgi:hypothetical protein
MIQFAKAFPDGQIVAALSQQLFFFAPRAWIRLKLAAAVKKSLKPPTGF